MDVYEQIVVKIVSNQEAIIGPVAIERAAQVPHLQLDWKNRAASIDGNETQTIDKLVEVYKELFGQISVEVCKEAVSSLMTQLSPDQLPETLK
jgi:hypothetical protein